MSSSQTNYVLNDALPQDSAGQRFWAFPNINSSALGFALPRGIGASIKLAGQAVYSAHLGVATHVGGSPIGASDVGFALLGRYNPPSATSPTTGQARHIGVNRHGELYAKGKAYSASLIRNGATNTVGGSPLLFHGYKVAGTSMSPGDSILFKDGTVTKFAHIFPDGHSNDSFIMEAGYDVLSSLIVSVVIGGAGQASATVLYKN